MTETKTELKNEDCNGLEARSPVQESTDGQKRVADVDNAYPDAVFHIGFRFSSTGVFKDDDMLDWVEVSEEEYNRVAASLHEKGAP